VAKKHKQNKIKNGEKGEEEAAPECASNICKTLMSVPSQGRERGMGQVSSKEMQRKNSGKR